MKKIMAILVTVVLSLSANLGNFSETLIEYQREIKDNYPQNSIHVSIVCTNIADLLTKIINDKDIPLPLETKAKYRLLIKRYGYLAILALDHKRPKTLEEFLAKLEEEPQPQPQPRSWIRRLSFSKK